MPLRVDGLEAGQQLEAEQLAEGEGHLALPDDQEISMLSLHLVQLSLVYVNTLWSCRRR